MGGFMKSKTLEKNMAVQMRQQGQSLNVISKHLSVSKSTVSRWVKSVKLTEKQKYNLKQSGSGFARKEQNVQHRKIIQKRINEGINRRINFQKDGIKKAKECNPLHIAGCMLYWAEGWKRNNRNSVSITNGDPFLLKKFLDFLRMFFNIQNNEIQLEIRYYPRCGTEEEIRSFWLQILNIPQTNKCIVRLSPDRRNNTDRDEGKLKYGTCQLRVHRTYIIQHIYGAIKEYAGINDPLLWVY